MNSMAFPPEEKENMKKLLKFLVEDYDSEEYYNEVHITTDGYCTIVEWDTVPYDRSFGGKFEYVDVDHERTDRHETDVPGLVNVCIKVL